MVTVAKEEKMLHQQQDPCRLELLLKKKWVDLAKRRTKQEKKLQLQKTYILRKKLQTFTLIFPDYLP